LVYVFFFLFIAIRERERYISPFHPVTCAPYTMLLPVTQEFAAAAAAAARIIEVEPFAEVFVLFLYFISASFLKILRSMTFYKNTINSCTIYVSFFAS
jgi:hypothetical protein